jgi:hypothetical protein
MREARRLNHPPAQDGPEKPPTAAMGLYLHVPRTVPVSAPFKFFFFWLNFPLNLGLLLLFDPDPHSE